MLLLLLLLLLLFLLFFIFLLLLILIVLVLLILLLLFLLTLAEFQVVTGLIVLRIVAQRLLVGFYGLAEHLTLLTHHTHVVVGLSPADGIILLLGSSLQLTHCRRILMLAQQCRTQVVVGLWVAHILLHGLTIGHLCIGEVALTKHLVALSDELTVVLCLRCLGYK